MFREAWRMAPVRGLCVALIGIVPWYIATGFKVNWEFVRAVLVYQNFTRFFTGFDHLQPWWMYAQSIWGDLMPLCLLLPFGLYYGFRYARREFRWRLLLIWTVWTVVFFSISASKQSKYILPAAPAMALLALAAIEPVFKTDNLHRVVRLLLGGFAVAIIAVFGMLIVCFPLLTIYVPRIKNLGGIDGFKAIKAQVAKAPAPIVSYRWPRSMTLYVLGAPMVYVRSSRDLYAQISAGSIKPGDYILVDKYDLPVGGEQVATKLIPAPAEPAFTQVMEVQAEDPHGAVPGEPGGGFDGAAQDAGTADGELVGKVRHRLDGLEESLQERAWRSIDEYDTTQDHDHPRKLRPTQGLA